MRRRRGWRGRSCRPHGSNALYCHDHSPRPLDPRGVAVIALNPRPILFCITQRLLGAHAMEKVTTVALDRDCYLVCELGRFRTPATLYTRDNSAGQSRHKAL